jgi:polysaccharide biosynthesis transport protein
MDTTKNFDTPEVKLHFLDYWRIIRIRKTVIIAVFLLVTITTTVVTLILPKSYSSTVKIAIEKDASDVSGLGAENRAAAIYDPYWIQTEFEKIQAKYILYPVITNLNLQVKWAEKFKETQLPIDFTYALLKGQMDVRQYRNTSLIEISVLSEDRNEAAEIANEIAKVYKETRLNRFIEYTMGGIKSLEDEWKKVDQAVTNKQNEVDKLKDKLKISDIEAQGFAITPTLEPETMRQFERERIASQTEYTRLFTLYTELTNLPPPELRQAVATASPDVNLNKLLEQSAESQQRMALLEKSLAPEHPDVIGLKSLITRIDQQIDDRINGILEGLKARANAEKARLDGLEKEVKDATQRDIDKAIERRPYFLAKRDLEDAQLVRKQLYLRIQQEKIDVKIPTSRIVEITDKAEPALRAARPRVFVNIALGVIVGLAVGVGLAFFIEYLDTSVKTIDDVERALQAPVLGVIPQNVGTLVDEGPDSPHAEAYRVLRTNILFSQKDPKLNTVTIVSAGAGEGKSTTIFNLATIFAQQGSRVLIVDSDLRRPSLHKLLRVSNSIGLTNYLLKQNSLEEVIQTTPLSTMDFMPSGKLPSSSMGILSSAQMKELIRDLKRRYDYVFFDSPPIMGVSDASILASEVDCVMQVIQYRRYPQPMTIRAKQMIEKVGGNLLGIVLNNINLSSDENYYYYSGYYYDYYSKSDDSQPETTARDSKAEKAPPKTEEKVEIKPKY